MGKRMLLIAKILLKLLVLIILAVGFAVEYINTAEINSYLRYTYIFVMFVCSFSFLFTFIKKYRQIAYIVFILSFMSFLLMGRIPAIKLIHDSIACLEAEKGVWDYTLNICRQDCLTWDKELGCIPVTKENISKYHQ